MCVQIYHLRIQLLLYFGKGCDIMVSYLSLFCFFLLLFLVDFVFIFLSVSVFVLYVNRYCVCLRFITMAHVGMFFFFVPRERRRK